MHFKLPRWLYLFDRHGTRHRPFFLFSLFTLRTMSSQESQRPEQEIEDDDGLATGPLLVTKLQVSFSFLDVFLFELDASLYSMLLISCLLSLGIWYQCPRLQEAYRYWLTHRRVGRVYTKEGVNVYQRHLRS